MNHVTVWEVGCERQVEIRGPDGYAFMEYLTPRDLSTCEVGQAKYVVLTDEQGGLVNDPVLRSLAKNRFWLSTADSDVFLWAKGVAYHSDFDVKLREPDVSPMQIQRASATWVPCSRPPRKRKFGWKLTLTETLRTASGSSPKSGRMLRPARCSVRLSS